MKFFISIVNVNHSDSCDHFAYEGEADTNNFIFNFLAKQIVKLNSTPNMTHKFQSILESLKEQDILSYSSYKEASTEYSNDNDVVLSETLLRIELHRLFNRKSGNPFLVDSRSYTHSISVQVLLHS
jgi:hypothetical protein